MILDVFNIVFEADTGQAEDGLDRTRKSTEELVDEMQAADEQAKKTGGSFKGFAALAAGALASVLASSKAISGAIGRAQDVTAINQTADALGVAVGEVDAFGKAMTALGGDAQGARDSLTDMAESIGEAMQDVESGRAKTFGALGISLKDVNGQSINAVEGLMRVADAVQGMSKGEAVFRIKELGITDNRTVEALLKGRQELERLIKVQKEANPLTKEQVERSQKLNEQMGAWRNSIGNAAGQFFDKLIPALTKVIGWLTAIVDWAGEHQHAVVGFFTAITAVILAMYLPAMISAAAATLAATWPLIAIGAAIVAVAAAFALVYDDIMNFIEGNESFIGQIFEKYPMVKAFVFALIDAFKLMGRGVAAVFTFLVDSWKAAFDFIMKGINAVKSGLSTVAEFFGFGGDEAPAVPEANAAISSASANPMNSVSSNAISNTANNSSEQNIQIGQVVVETQATDSQGISQAIGGDLQSQLKALEAETATGVAR